MSNEKRINVEKVTKVKRFGVAYNEEEFLLVFNSEEEDFSDGEAFAIPAKALKRVIDGLNGCGVEYQKRFGTDIGFAGKGE